MSDASTDAPRGRTYRPVSGRVVLVLVVIMAIVMLVDALVRAGIVQTLLIAPWVLLAVWIVYELSYVSSVVVDARGARVTNLLRVTSFGWDRVRDIDLKWQLVFTLMDGTDVTAMGGPARSRPARAPRGDEEAGASVPRGIRVLDEIRERWQAAPDDADAPIRRSWDWPALAALAIIVIWAITAILITR